MLENIRTRRSALFAILSLLNFAFLVYYFVLAFNMRMHYDDIHFLWRAQFQSLGEYLNWVYYDRSGRMSVYAMNWIVSRCSNTIGVYWFWPILYMGLGWLLCMIFARSLNLGLRNRETFALVIFVYNLYILTSVDFAVFYWLSAMQYFIMGPALLSLVAYANKHALQVHQWVMLVLVCIIVGLGFEYWTIVVLFALFLNGLYYLYTSEWHMSKAIQRPQVKRLIVIALILLSLLAVALSAPGMYARVEEGANSEGMIHPSGFLAMIRAYLSAMVSFSYFQAFYLPYYLVVALVFMCIGKEQKGSIALSSRLIVIVLIATALVFAVSFIPPAYIYGGFGIQRYYTPIVLLLILVFALLGLYTGSQILTEKKSRELYYVSVTSVVALLGIMIINMCNDFPIARSWSNAVDARKQQVLEQRDLGRTENLEVTPLPDPLTVDTKVVCLRLLGKSANPSQTLFYTSDVATSPNDYSIFIRKAYHLNFDIVPLTPSEADDDN